MTSDTDTDLDDLPIVTDQSAARLTDRHELLYRDHREKLARWAITMGKNPKRADGYAPTTVKQRLFRLDRFNRFVWDEHDTFTLDLGTAEADDWMRHLAKTDNTQTYNAACQKAVKLLFKWRQDEYAEAISWDPVITFSSNTAGTTPRHYFALDTLNRLASASLEVDSLPSPQSVTPEERDSIEAYLAMQFGKPKHAVTHEDWQRADSWKIPAMIHMTIDGGLRNKEVKEAKVS